MTNPHQSAPFSIAVALPTALKSLVERMLQSVLRDQPLLAARWHLSDAPTADVTFRLHGDDGQAISPDLLADVRRSDGRHEIITVEGAWRRGAMAAALAHIAELVAAKPAQDTSALAMQWLQHWCALRAQADAAVVELRIGDQRVAVIDTRLMTLRFVDGTAALDANALIARIAREGWTLAPLRSTGMRDGVSVKPLLWELGLRAGVLGPMPALRTAGTLRLKGWPYLAAGGPPAFSELIKHLRNGDNDRASLRARNIAPPALVDGFLNACRVCDFFHDGVATLAAPPAPRATMAVAGEQAAISAIRRTLGILRP